MHKGASLRDRAGGLKPRALLRGLGLSALIPCAALLAADYAWWRGFNDGADTLLCVQFIQVDGNESAMNESACRNIKGKKPPPDLFGMKAP